MRTAAWILRRCHAGGNGPGGREYGGLAPCRSWMVPKARCPRIKCRTRQCCCSQLSEHLVASCGSTKRRRQGPSERVMAGKGPPAGTKGARDEIGHRK